MSHEIVIKTIFETLNEKEKKVLMFRFGIGDRIPQTLEQVGQIFGVTRERIRQIEAKAIRKVQHRARANNVQFEDFL